MRSAGSQAGSGWAAARWALVVGGVVVALDQATKALVVRALGPGQDEHRVEILGSVLALHYAENTGAAFGIFSGLGRFLTPIALLVTAVLLISIGRMVRPSPLAVIGTGLLIGGAAGNLIDRLRLGYVVDFISVSIWPKFNIADSAITVGIALLAVPLLRESAPERDDHDVEPPPAPRVAGAERQRAVADVDS